MLLAHGTDMEVGGQGFTPLLIAVAIAQELVINALLEKGASAGGAAVICTYFGLCLGQR